MTAQAEAAAVAVTASAVKDAAMDAVRDAAKIAAIEASAQTRRLPAAKAVAAENVQSVVNAAAGAAVVNELINPKKAAAAKPAPPAWTSAAQSPKAGLRRGVK